MKSTVCLHFQGEWMDASDFFNNKHPNSRTAQLAFEETPGCKRSSIIAIRTQKKGHVSRNVETFMKPALPPPPMGNTPRRGTRPPARTPTSACIPPSGGAMAASGSSRRTSARMGIATCKTPTGSGTGSGNGMVTRRQTLTGIRTSVVPSEGAKRASMQRNSPIIKAEHTVLYTGNIQEPIYDNVEYKKIPPNNSLSNKKTSEVAKTPTRRTNTPKGMNMIEKLLHITIMTHR